MTESNANGNLSAWEQEVLVRHRWGQHGEEAYSELERLRELWKAAKPMDEDCEAIIDQIIVLEICNWNLEESILAICEGIGNGKAVDLAIGHLTSITDERWREVWAYYVALRSWLVGKGPNGYSALLNILDPGKEVEDRLTNMLGERNELKELYVERFCLCLERWLGHFPGDSVTMKAHEVSVSAVEQAIRQRDPEGHILNAMKSDGDGRLIPCSHKAFRRYDIIISSIGAGKWRAAMPMRGTDGFQRAENLERYLTPIELWVDGKCGEDELSSKICPLLGELDSARAFLASFLVSVLRAQGIAARKRAEGRTKRKK